jgi:hypothetical protein
VVGQAVGGGGLTVATHALRAPGKIIHFSNVSNGEESCAAPVAIYCSHFYTFQVIKSEKIISRMNLNKACSNFEKSSVLHIFLIVFFL